MNRVYFLLGVNLGDRGAQLKRAYEEIENSIGTVTQLSSIYETEAWGKSGPSYLNQVIVVQTKLKPEFLLQTTMLIENKLGRTRNKKWESRLIDIDILFYGDVILNSERLIIPHPLIHKRKFTLLPLDEICSGLIHPIFNKTIRELLNELDDPLEVKKLS